MEEERRIEKLFEIHKERIHQFTYKLAINDEFLFFDYTKTHISTMNISNMFQGFNALLRKNAMFKGEKINYTEGKKVLHTSLRSRNVLNALMNQSKNVKLIEEEKAIYNELLKMQNFEEKFRNGELKGVTEKKLRTIVNIGIGGSDLGPRMVTEALHFYRNKNIDVHFVANIDSTEMLKVFEKIDPEETLFIVVSKTFTTLETIANAKLALTLMEEKLKVEKKELSNKHFVAVSANKEEILKFGIENYFDMWDFVGGRYSLWSAVGLSIILYIGFDNFLKLLNGASEMDQHFKDTDHCKNVPVIQALLEILYSNHYNYNNKCIVAYDEYLKNIYLYLQQAEMESNGKSSTLDGITKGNTGMLIWGGVGTSVQHSFFQLIHQGTRNILLEFLLPLKPLNDRKVTENSHFEMLFANCVAQSRALMIGSDNKISNKYFSGNKPSITICYSKLTPDILGALIAFYEHKIYIQGLFWKINSFDQFGVELGKKLAMDVLKSLNDGSRGFDESTQNILDLYLAEKKNEN